MPYGSPYAISSSSNTHNVTFASITLGATSTLCGWYYCNSGISNYNPIWGSDGNNEIYYGSGRAVGVYAKLEYLKGAKIIFTSVNNIVTGSWHFLAIVDDGLSLKAYYDDVDMGNSVPYTSSAGMVLSKTNQGLNSNNFLGMMDELLIFNRVLSAGELTTLYNSGYGAYGDITQLPWSSGSLLGYHFDEGSGDSAFDFTGHGKSGTLSAGTGRKSGVYVSSSYVIPNAAIINKIGNAYTANVTNNDSDIGQQRSVAFTQGINLGGPIDLYRSSFGRSLQVGITQSFTEGNPLVPSLQISYYGMWRFRWVVKTGTRSISINCKFPSLSTPRPSMNIKANPSIGIPSDIITYAPAGTGWVTIGPVSFVSTGTDVVWVELWNNVIMDNTSPCYFDHIVVG